ncbi:hypothetical protein B0G71_8256 [Paraburkholderia sp. BL27I4N3]|uniref:hypothetical protein n=1 Tax=Paraburkholderia sp. BL27I4N3 TaxID=1938805 RepID=UPI000E38C95E|nr:hypothetical protein [Paraburkholderia sp. BL27I4N3]REE06576.1 hypothetical protein B0G71_8256 [Paraburkholderia sp. BL27I4N3]
MRTVDIFKWISDEMLDDPRVLRYGMVLAKGGIKGLKGLDPVLVWIDAAVAVFDACGSYTRYLTQKELNMQLEIANQELRETTKAYLRMLELDYETIRQEQEHREAALARSIERHAAQRARILAEIKGQGDLVFRVHRLVCEARLHGYTQDLDDLQSALDTLVGASLACLTENIN